MHSLFEKQCRQELFPMERIIGIVKYIEYKVCFFYIVLYFHTIDVISCVNKIKT